MDTFFSGHFFYCYVLVLSGLLIFVKGQDFGGGGSQSCTIVDYANAQNCFNQYDLTLQTGDLAPEECLNHVTEVQTRMVNLQNCLTSLSNPDCSDYYIGLLTVPQQGIDHAFEACNPGGTGQGPDSPLGNGYQSCTAEDVQLAQDCTEQYNFTTDSQPTDLSPATCQSYVEELKATLAGLQTCLESLSNANCSAFFVSSLDPARENLDLVESICTDIIDQIPDASNGTSLQSCTADDIQQAQACAEQYNITSDFQPTDNTPDACQSYVEELQATLVGFQACLESLSNANCSAFFTSSFESTQKNLDLLASLCNTGGSMTFPPMIATLQPPVRPIGPDNLPGSPCSRDVSSAIMTCQMTYTAAIQSVNITYDMDACSILQSANTTFYSCLNQQLLLDSNCSSQVETAVATAGLWTSVNTAQDICKCPGGIVGVVNATQSCVLSTTTNISSYNTVCGSVDVYMNCMADSIDECPALLGLLETVLDGIAFSEVLYGCPVNIDSHMYQPTGCDFPAIIECYNPLLAATSRQEFNVTTNWETYLAQITSLLNEAKTNCSYIPNLNSMTQCARTHLQNCHYATFWHDFTGEKMWGSWRTQVSDQSLADVIPKAIDAMGDPVNSGSDMVYYTYSFAQIISLVCEADCANHEERAANYSQCEAQYTDDLTSVLLAVLEQYSQSGGYTTSPSNTSHCMILKNVIDCSTQYSEGCGYTEYLPTQVLYSPVLYAAMSICDVHFTFPLRWTPGICDTPVLVSNELEFTASICQDTLLQTADFFQQLTTPEQICSAYQEQAYCYYQNSRCCDSRKQLLTPMLHTWAMVNEKLPECTVYLKYSQNSRDKLKVLPMQTAVNDSGVSCSYDQVFSCYNDFLQKAIPTPLSVASLTTLTYTNLRQLYSIRDTILRAPATTCPSESQFSAAETCLRQFANKCTFPELCDTGSSPDTWRSLPLAEILLVDVKDVCTQACKTVNYISIQAAISNCTRQHVTSGNIQKLANTIVWNLYTGGQNTEHCSQMVDMTDCISRSLGSCTAYGDVLTAPKDSVISRAMMECNASFQAMVSTTPRPPQTTVQTLGAANTGSTAILIFLSALLTVIITI